jgi:hypothetical protein
MSPDGLGGGGAGGDVEVWAVEEDRHPSKLPHHFGMESVRGPETVLSQYGDARGSTRRRKKLCPVFRCVGGQCLFSLDQQALYDLEGFRRECLVRRTGGFVYLGGAAGAHDGCGQLRAAEDPG